MAKLIEIKWWERYWRLTLTWRDKFERHWKKNNRIRFVECVCDCWKVVWVRLGGLRFETRSCWCLTAEVSKHNTAYRTKHWMYKTRIYGIYRWVKGRCSNPNHISYKYYWWKWIKILWERFEDFYRDMWDSYNEHVKLYWEKETTLDRINRDWDYCKENCKWSTRKEQMYNREIVDLYWFDYTSFNGEKQKMIITDQK